MHDKCVHYQLIEGAAVEVEKDDWFDYCTDDPDEDDPMIEETTVRG
jgi:hypothetical protein